jgi:hypothetical protein
LSELPFHEPIVLRWYVRDIGSVLLPVQFSLALCVMTHTYMHL